MNSENLIALIDGCESMDDNERQYWKDTLPSMKDVEISRLTEVLTNEKEKLAEVERKYQEEIKTLNEKHLIEWQEFQREDNRVNFAE
jgi:hypothetical protein